MMARVNKVIIPTHGGKREKEGRGNREETEERVDFSFSVMANGGLIAPAGTHMLAQVRKSLRETERNLGLISFRLQSFTPFRW